LADDEAEGLAEEVEQWIHRHPILRRDYSWPVNSRELEQCVRIVIIRKEYQPAYATGHDAADDPRRGLAVAVQEGTLSLSELERRHCTLAYSQAATWGEAADRWGSIVAHTRARSTTSCRRS